MFLTLFTPFLINELLQLKLKFLRYHRAIQFDLVVEKTPLIRGLQTLEDAVSSYLHVCFVANMQYPKVYLIFATIRYHIYEIMRPVKCKVKFRIRI